MGKTNYNNIDETKKRIKTLIDTMEQNILGLKKEYKDATGQEYDKSKDAGEYAMARVLTRIYGKSKHSIVSDKEFREIAKKEGYDIRGASALFKKHLVKLAWNRVGLTQYGQMYVEALSFKLN